MYKVLYIENQGNRLWGGQISLYELITHLDRREFKPIVVCGTEGKLVREFRNKGIEVQIISMPTFKTIKIWAIYQAITRLRQLARDNKIAIVHTNGSKSALYGILAFNPLHLPVIWHVRETIKDIYLYELFLLKFASKIICVAGAVKKERFGRFALYFDKMQVVYNGVDINKFSLHSETRMKIRTEFGIEGHQILIGIIGAFIPLKGHRYLFEALKLINMEHPACPATAVAIAANDKVKLLVVGKERQSGYEDELKRMVASLGIRSVIFSEFRRDVSSILAGIDIFVLPSEREGLSRILIEAMATGCSIIATKVGGNPEVVIHGTTGLLVEPRNPKALATAILELINNPVKSKDMGLAARRRAIDYFSIEAHTNQIEHLYCELVK
ncbi:MAG: glycosyltransferase family 4 protein [Candidatus Stahlbacteria bacterium]|nr:glycosyltransferase family 4 protein [Candidatus Stahlbacteria bacterium]